MPKIKQTKKIFKNPNIKVYYKYVRDTIIEMISYKRYQ